jgi:hypothetical protein
MALNLYTTPVQGQPAALSVSPLGARPPAAAATTAAPAAASPFAAAPNQDIFSMLSTILCLMANMLNAASGRPGNPAANPAVANLAGTTPLATANPAAGTFQQLPGGLNQAQTGGAAPLNVFTQNDYRNFLLAGSQGGRTGTAESINSAFADPGSRFARTGNNEFQAATAGMYANQFKAYALGLDAAFAPGKDINQLSANLVQAQNTQMTPEAEMLSKVAALYRGNLTGSNLYNNPVLKQLLVKWGRTDIASQPNVGNPNGDVQSIGGVVKALNEEPNPEIRKAWLQEIFDFAGNSPTSPSGAVPNVREYQVAIDIVRSGRLDQLLGSFLNTAGS